MYKIFKVERDILIYAIRYALGRQTFAPSTTIENVKENIDLFTINDLKIIIRDIISQEYYGYGMECDKQNWLGFKEYLEIEIKKRIDNGDLRL